MKKLIGLFVLIVIVLQCGCQDHSGQWNVQYIRTNGYHEEIQYPVINVVSSRYELESYYNNHKDMYDLSSRSDFGSDNTVGFYDFIQKYTDSYFISHYLVIVVLQENSGSIRHQVKNVAKNGEIMIDRLMPAFGDCDMAEWHLIVELNSSFHPKQFTAMFTDEKI